MCTARRIYGSRIALSGVWRGGGHHTGWRVVKGFTATFGTPILVANRSITSTLTLAGSASAVAVWLTLNLRALCQPMQTGVVYTASVNLPMTVTLIGQMLKR